MLHRFSFFLSLASAQVQTSTTWEPSEVLNITETLNSTLIDCNDYCIALNGEASYCKSWLPSPVCFAGNQGCSIEECVDLSLSTTTSTDEPTIEPSSDVTSTTEQPTTTTELPTTTEIITNSEDATTTTAEPSSTEVSLTNVRVSCDYFCQHLNGLSSYCKSWLPVPSCLSGDQLCSEDLCFLPTVTTAEPTTTTIVSTTAEPTTETTTAEPVTETTTTSEPISEAATTFSPPLYVCDEFCQSLNGGASYCKFWLSPAVCQWGNQLCGSCPNAPMCDTMCETLNPGQGSYCKYYQHNPVCAFGHQPCGPSTCVPSSLWEVVAQDFYNYDTSRANWTLADWLTATENATDEWNALDWIKADALSLTSNWTHQDWISFVYNHTENWTSDNFAGAAAQLFGDWSNETTAAFAAWNHSDWVAMLDVATISWTNGQWIEAVHVFALYEAEAIFTANEVDGVDGLIGCDSYCQAFNSDPATYCKYWLDVPVCAGYAVPCLPEIIPCNVNSTRKTQSGWLKFN